MRRGYPGHDDEADSAADCGIDAGRDETVTVDVNGSCPIGPQ